jgi:D-glycero-D-manno-heptose 1,7-bisphosphate phosphatase
VRTGKGARLDDAAIAKLLAEVPGTQVHADLAAFAEALIQYERDLRGDNDKSVSGYSRLE